MSKTYNMLADSLNEIIADYDENRGTNLTHDILTKNASKETIETLESDRNTSNPSSRLLELLDHQAISIFIV